VADVVHGVEKGRVPVPPEKETLCQIHASPNGTLESRVIDIYRKLKKEGFE